MIQNIKNNDTLAFKDFFDEYKDCLFYYFLKKTKSYADAEELTQLTFIKFWEYRKSLSEELPVKVQLFHKARLVFIDWLRKEATLRKQRDSILNNKEQFTIPEEEYIDPRIRKIENSIAKLPSKRKVVFELFEYHGYSYKQIAKILHISSKTVDNHLSQAIKQIRKMLSSVL